MKKKLQVFISSTYEDMKIERQAAVEAVLRAGHIPAGMELFAAGDESQWETICRWINDSDIFMLVLGGRYGSIEPKSDKSYVQLEYEYAISHSKPHFAAVISDEFLRAKVKAVGPEAMEAMRGQHLHAFREIVKQKTSRFFENVDQLKLIVMESLAHFERNEGLIGWVRGSDVVDPKAILADMERLRAENQSFRAEVDELKRKASTGTPPVFLDDDARELLVTARNADGYIMYIKNMVLQIGIKNFLEAPATQRDEARWKAAIDVLLDQRLIERQGNEGFGLTKKGYEIADQIAEKKV